MTEKVDNLVLQNLMRNLRGMSSALTNDSLLFFFPFLCYLLQLTGGKGKTCPKEDNPSPRSCKGQKSAICQFLLCQNKLFRLVCIYSAFMLMIQAGYLVDDSKHIYFLSHNLSLPISL